ncbi:hypothetical protein TRAPUB_9804 [Trametes pubescens]|uniref:Uncharacterized protein n=1 Tax=Trametes pubescens TaxID=154538 RepID=A0A1M2W169_TRAPU|nr:hypothetical protein TRAPUB_9804 [Trametes pubescens]
MKFETQSDITNATNPNKRGAPFTPSEHAAKKFKHDTSEDQPQTSTSLTPGLRANTPPPATDSEPTKYILHLSDTKTRTEPTLPPDEDTLSSRVQLMLYHRLLSDLLATAAPAVRAHAPLNFAVLWGRVKANPSGAWTRAVKALNVTTVDHTLTLVYLSQIIRKRRKDQSQSMSVDTEPSSQEAQDLAAAIQASVSDGQGVTNGGALGSTTLEGSSLKLSEGSASAPRAPDALERDPERARAIRQDAAAIMKVAAGTEAHATPSAIGERPSTPNDKLADGLTAAKEKEDSGTKTAPARSDELVEADETMSVAELDVEARVIGTKAFQLDDSFLDGYLTSILAWWHGRRAAEGVGEELTRRCT